LPFSSFSDKLEPGLKPGFLVNDLSEPAGLEERLVDLDINPGSCKPVLEMRFDLLTDLDIKPGLEEGTDSYINTGFSRPHLGETFDSDVTKPGLGERTESDINTDFSKPGLEERTESGNIADFREPGFDSKKKHREIERLKKKKKGLVGVLRERDWLQKRGLN
ncbi:hypothetical protein CARUB_v10028358mg, partial [Capsella rubella]